MGLPHTKARTAEASARAERPGVLRPGALALIALVVLAAISCAPPSTTGGDASTTSHQESSSDSVGSTSSTNGDLQVDGYNFDSQDVFVRSCDSQLFGGERLGPTAEADDVIGPLVMSGLSTVDEFEPEDLVPDSNGELKILKFPTELAGPHAVWFGISPEDRTEASLIYDSSRWSTDTGRLPLTAGDAVVGFESCHDNGGFTQYNGGILVKGPICITMEVWEGDVSLEPLTKRVAFGSGTQC